MTAGSGAGCPQRGRSGPRCAVDLSVVVPTLNEARVLPGLIETLSCQRGLRFQIVIADGGSRDDTLERCREAARQYALDLSEVQTRPGRARQMNAGARCARAADLLFLHADSVLEEPDLLAGGHRRMMAEREQRSTDRVAGHFGVRFRRSESHPSGLYYFYESKTRLNRPDCINGDQGFWLSRRYFRELGAFDESLPYMEDARLAARVFATGGWIDLPGRISTSARRFEAEGLLRRQTLNALICNAENIGLKKFFEAAHDAYRVQKTAGRLRVGPFLRIAHRVSLGEGLPKACAYWYRTGAYVAENAWQLAFAVDCARNRRAGHPPGEGPTPWLDRFDRRGAPVVTSIGGRVVTALLTAAWFYGSLILSRR